IAHTVQENDPAAVRMRRREDPAIQPHAIVRGRLHGTPRRAALARDRVGPGRFHLAAIPDMQSILGEKRGSYGEAGQPGNRIPNGAAHLKTMTLRKPECLAKPPTLDGCSKSHPLESTRVRSAKVPGFLPCRYVILNGSYGHCYRQYWLDRS